MEPVHVLPGIDGLDDRSLVDMVGKRELHQDSVDLGVGVELPDQRQELVLGSLVREGVLPGMDSHVPGGAVLHTDVHLGSRVFTHQHRRQPRRHPLLFLEERDALLELSADLFRDVGAGNDLSAHLPISDKGARSPGRPLQAPSTDVRQCRKATARSRPLASPGPPPL